MRERSSLNLSRNDWISSSSSLEAFVKDAEVVRGGWEVGEEEWVEESREEGEEEEDEVIRGGWEVGKAE